MPVNLCCSGSSLISRTCFATDLHVHAGYRHDVHASSPPGAHRTLRRVLQRRNSPPSGQNMVRIGCSGWQYKHWKGDFYPADLRTGEWFTRYAATFDTVE